MSLLLDALKEAEHHKRRAHAGGAAERSNASLEMGGSEDSALSLADEVTQSRPELTAKNATAKVQVARLADIAALHPEHAAPRAKAGNRLQWLLVALSIVVLLLSAAYVYLMRTNDTAPMSQVATVLLPATTTRLPVATPPEHALPPATLVPQAQTRNDTPEPPRPRERSQSAAALARVNAPIVIVGSTTGSPLLAAYEALQTGDLARARLLYEQVLAAEPMQADAHLGLGVIAQSQQDRTSAINHFRSVLLTVPDQPRAWSGLAELAGDGELAQLESKLRGLIATRPESSLHFALGNNLMRQSRWAEAQEQLFAAATDSPDNAEYRFNLAVALDRLGKRDVAAEHYRRALDLAQGRPVQFDTAAVRSRVAVIAAGES